MPPEHPTTAGNAAVLRRVVERLPAAAVFREGECLWLNRAAEALVGHARADVATLDAWFARLYPGRAGDVRALYEADRAAGFPAPCLVWLVRGDGEERHVEFAGFNEDGAEIWLLSDATEPERLDRLLAQTARAARVGGWEVDCRTGRLFWTEETYHIHETNPASYHPEVATAIAFYAPESVGVINEAVRRGMELGEGYDLELELITARGRRIWVRAIGVTQREGGQTVRLFGSFQDVTARKLAEQERQLFERNLQETQKLESLGVLAGGIAHDFNNLLTGIMGNAELVRLTAGASGGAIEGYLDQIERTSERAADLCRQMLAYAGKGRFVVELVELASLTREAMPLLQASISKKATLTVCVPQRLPTVSADPTQISQVLLNLVINASEALEDREGMIAVAARVERLDAATLAAARVGSDCPEGDYVCLEVSDVGTGMDEATLARVFEPFFSTKFTGRGLGLAAVLGIVRRHAGVLLVRSAPGRGSNFRACFPPAGPAKEPTLTPSGHGLASAKRPTVLVVDDEDSVRQSTAGLCRMLGYGVVEACDGADALRKLDETPGVAAMLLDWTMPRRDGASTAAHVRRQRPEVAVIVMSGYSETELAGAVEGLGAGFLKKPFTLEQLTQRLREALGERR